jgi:hypothetical protein
MIKSVNDLLRIDGDQEPAPQQIKCIAGANPANPFSVALRTEGIRKAFDLILGSG